MHEQISAEIEHPTKILIRKISNRAPEKKNENVSSPEERVCVKRKKK